MDDRLKHVQYVQMYVQLNKFNVKLNMIINTYLNIKINIDKYKTIMDNQIKCYLHIQQIKRLYNEINIKRNVRKNAK